MHRINWQTGLLRVWTVLSVLWLIGCASVGLVQSGHKLTLARMSDIALVSYLCADEAAKMVPPPPPGFIPDTCIKKYGRHDTWRVGEWGSGDSYGEQAFRVSRAFAPELVLLFAPPVVLLLLGMTIVWVARGFVRRPT
jgi:hypothetical protein